MSKTAWFCRILTYSLVVFFSILFLAPFAWLLITSLKTQLEIYRFPPTLIPHQLTFQNYYLAVTMIPYLRYTLNTLLITVLSVTGQVISSSMVAYSVSKIRWKGANIIFPLIIATMMIPTQVTMIPLYIVFTRAGLVGSILPLVLPTFCGGAYYIFLLRQFFKTIPDSLVEAATIDGAGSLKI